MKISYRVSEQDYIKGLKLHHKITYKHLLFFTLFLTAVTIVTNLVHHTPFGWRDLFTIFVALLAVGLWFLLYHKFILPWIAKRDFRKYKSIQEPMQIELLDDAIMIDKERGNFDILFKNLLKYRQNDDYILLYPMPRIFYIIPKTLGKEGLDVALLLEKLHEFGVKEV